MQLDETDSAQATEGDALAEIVDLDEEDFDDEIEEDYEDEDDFDLGMSIDETDEEAEDLDDVDELEPAETDAGETPEAQPPSGAVAINPDQLEAALEKVVEKAFSDKIEKILVSVVEKTVKSEITRLRDLLMDDY